jgi:hypothetical protein
VRLNSIVALQVALACLPNCSLTNSSGGRCGCFAAQVDVEPSAKGPGALLLGALTRTVQGLWPTPAPLGLLFTRLALALCTRPHSPV